MDTLSSGEKLECWSSNQNESDCAWSWSNVGANIVAGVIVLILQCVVLLLYQKIFLPNVKELVERVGKKEEKIEENQRKIAVVQEELKEMISDITETWKRSGGRELMEGESQTEEDEEEEFKSAMRITAEIEEEEVE